MATTLVPPYKHLAPIAESAEKITNVVDRTYRMSKSYLPNFAKPMMEVAEDKVSTVGAPLLHTVQDRGQKSLQFVDMQVDALVNWLNDLRAYVQDMHKTNFQAFQKAREDHLKAVEENFDKVKTKLDPSPVINGVYANIVSIVSKVWDATDPDDIAKSLAEMGEKIADVGPVSKVLDLLHPVLEFNKNTYNQVHDTVTGLPLYSMGYHTVVSLSQMALDNPLYLYAKDLVYPWIRPVADAVYDRVTSSKVIQQAVNQLRPRDL